MTQRSHSARIAIRRIIRAFDRPIIRLYGLLRFVIFRQRFLQEIGQYLPGEGRVLDIGCGVGLFSNFFAQVNPGCLIEGFDIDAGRIEIARQVAHRLDIRNVEFYCADVVQCAFERQYQAAYMIDVLHHIPREQVVQILLRLSLNLPIGGRLIIKDVLTTPSYKALFTLVLDRLISGRGYIKYWEIGEMRAILSRLGFEVHHHEMVDWLPYSHVLFIARKEREADPETCLKELLPEGVYHKSTAGQWLD